MNIALFFLSLALPSLAGYTLLFKEEFLSQGEKIIFSFTLGTGLLSFYLFVLGMIGVHFSVWSSAVFFVPFLTFGILKRRDIATKVSLSVPSPLSGLSPPGKALFTVLVSLILWKFFYMIFIVLSSPTIFWDAYTLWNYKAKVIYYAHGVSMNPADEGFLGGAYAHYPLNLPLIRAWTAFFTGEWDDSIVNLHAVVLFVCLLGLVFAVLKKEVGKLPAMVFTYILTGLPVLTYNVISGYADIAVGYYFLASVIMLFYWHKTRNNKFLVFAGMISAIAMFTKNEGVAIVLPAVFLTFLSCLFTTRHSWKFILGSICSFFLSSFIILFWLSKSGALSAIIEISEIRGTRFTFHTEGLMPLFHHLFLYRNFNIFWAGVILVMAIRWKKVFRPDARFFMIPALVSLSMVLYVFLFTSNVQWLINGTTINRTMVIVIPVLLVASGFLVAGEKADLRGSSAGLPPAFERDGMK